MDVDGGWGDLIGMYRGTPLIVHRPDVCAGHFCCIHNPSDHPLDKAPLNWRGHVMERICRHGIGHPDPDDLAWRERVGRDSAPVHGCDGCCCGRGPVDPPAPTRAVGVPWGRDQVDSLNRYQESGLMHPYTCPNRAIDHRETGGDRGVLVATVDGWRCPDCDYTQDWAHRWSADGTWEQLAGPAGPVGDKRGDDDG